jgi:hypothetical protein
MSGKGTEGKTCTDQLDALWDTVLEELNGMSERDALDGEDPEQVKIRSLKRLERAVVEAGRRRMAAAKHGLNCLARQSTETRSVPSIFEAREFIKKIAGDSRYTLAARQLEELSEEEVLRLYRQLQELEAKHLESGR